MYAESTQGRFVVAGGERSETTTEQIYLHTYKYIYKTLIQP